jgi:hypothetical protein
MLIPPDRTETASYLRIVERGRTTARIDVVRDLRAVVRQHGFRPVFVGSMYILQGEMARLVASSVTTGLVGLMALFSVIAFKQQPEPQRAIASSPSTPHGTASGCNWNASISKVTVAHPIATVDHPPDAVGNECGTLDHMRGVGIIPHACGESRV